MKESKFKEVLIFVAGTTPQIITETMYALIHKHPPVRPDEAYVITSAFGKKLIVKHLLESGIFSEFCKEFKIRESLLNQDSIIVITDRKGNELDDIRNGQENEYLGDFITEFIKGKASDQSARLHCSLAGGRKTMSFYLGSALQLFGRSWDKLYHVLVTPEFESNPDFYYKPNKNKTLEKDGRRMNTKDAEIFLAELPFIRLREKIHLDGMGFKELVSEGQKEIDTALTQPFVRVLLRDGLVSIGNNNIEFKPFHIVFYMYLLKQKLERCPYPDRVYCLECSDCFVQINDLATPAMTEALARDYGLLYGAHSGHVENFRRQWKEGIDLAKLRSDRSKINRDIIENLQDDTLATYYTITSLRKYGATRFGIKVEKGKIRIA